MRDWKKTFRITTVVVIVFTCLYVIFLLSAKALVINGIQKATGLKTTINKFTVWPPLSVEMRGLEIAGLIKVDRAYVSLSIPSFLRGRMGFNKIILDRPEASYQHSLGQVSVPKETPAAQPPAASAAKKPLLIQVKVLKIYSGKLNFTDNTSPDKPINILVKDVNCYITNLANFAAKGVSNFNFRSNISWNSGEPDGKISLKGWLNFQKKDIDAELKIEDIDAIVFYPYYSTWVDLEKARIEKAKLGFNCLIKGTNNNIEASCRLKLLDIVRRVRGPEEKQEKAERLTDAVLDMFKSMNDQGEVVLDFVLHTKLDRPEFGFASIKTAFEGKLMQARTQAGMRPQDMLTLPARWVQSGVKTGQDLSNAFVDGIFDLSMGIKRFFEDRMNRQAPPQESHPVSGLQVPENK